ncbi:SusE domain-containing protein [Bacteroides sp. 224]|uniref:SusE domain-containing protein n=1 Tax=Bacteroides sp. 224 TaxID=2302936 RepID=UPI0013D8592C|nr:SusE domain-containing protein [Bacteroides sp. 224]NDV63695.1 hypothetical protein [Bacteroides sp. 224]
MKRIKYIYILALSVVLFTACDSDLDEVTYNEQTAQAAVLKAIGSSYVLEANKADDIVFDLNWSTPNMGYQAEVTNTIEIDLKGKDFANSIIIASSKTENTYQVIANELNGKILSLLEKYEMDLTAIDLDIRIASSISDAINSIYSNVVTSNITPYSGEPEYPKVWVIGDYCGWSHDASQHLFSFANNESYEAIVDFGEKAANGFKVTGEAGWTAAYNWGLAEGITPETEATSIQLIADGSSGNITAYSKRFYRLKMNTNTLLLTNVQSFTTLSIIGNAVNNDETWSTDIEMNFDSSKQRFWVDAELTNGNMKFRLDKSWNVSYGIDGKEGILNGSDNIPVVAGNYRVYVNLNNSNKITYELNSKDYGKE